MTRSLGQIIDCDRHTDRPPMFDAMTPSRRLTNAVPVSRHRTTEQIMDALPSPGTLTWVELPGFYVDATRTALEAAGIPVADSWIDPMDPRDATIVLESLALVWDEVGGWRHGRFVSGRKGVRTVLEDGRSFGGGLLPEPSMVVAAVRCVLDGTVIGTQERPVFRHCTDLGDGTDERLAAYAPRTVLR
jgi:hypothetical protein